LHVQRRTHESNSVSSTSHFRAPNFCLLFHYFSSQPTIQKGSWIVKSVIIYMNLNSWLNYPFNYEHSYFLKSRVRTPCIMHRNLHNAHYNSNKYNHISDIVTESNIMCLSVKLLRYLIYKFIIKRIGVFVLFRRYVFNCRIEC